MTRKQLIFIGLFCLAVQVLLVCFWIDISKFFLTTNVDPEKTKRLVLLIVIGVALNFALVADLVKCLLKAWDNQTGVK